VRRQQMTLVRVVPKQLPDVQHAYSVSVANTLWGCRTSSCGPTTILLL
jgi:hypothetical protein